LADVVVVLVEDLLPIESDDDVVRVRQQTRARAIECGLRLVEQTKIVTAASELARNTLIHGQGGSLTLELLDDGRRRGLRLTFADQGPGIGDIELALRPGFTTGAGLGLGLSGSRKLVDEFSIHSTLGQGTRVTAVKWK
jgi:serine/threonine-protein kinase RsbT